MDSLPHPPSPHDSTSNNIPSYPYHILNDNSLPSPLLSSASKSDPHITPSHTSIFPLPSSHFPTYSPTQKSSPPPPPHPLHNSKIPNPHPLHIPIPIPSRQPHTIRIVFAPFRTVAAAAIGIEVGVGILIWVGVGVGVEDFID